MQERRGYLVFGRSRRRLRGCALVVAGVAAAAACGGGESEGRTAPRPGVISIADARHVVATYCDIGNRANRAFNVGLVAQVETDPSLAIDAAGYKLKRATHARPYRPFCYDSLQFSIPAVSAVSGKVADSVWFAVQGRVTTNDLWGMLLFIRTGQGWREALSTYLPAGKRMPELAHDSDGHPVPVGAQDARGLVASPRAVAELHTELLLGGPRSRVSGRFAANLESTTIWQNTDTQRRHLGHDSTGSAWGQPYGPLVAFRTADGGTVAVYAVKSQFRANLIDPRRYYMLSGNYRVLAGTGRAEFNVTGETVTEWLTYIPPAGRTGTAGQLRVLGHYSGDFGGLTGVAAR